MEMKNIGFFSIVRKHTMKHEIIKNVGKPELIDFFSFLFCYLNTKIRDNKNKQRFDIVKLKKEGHVLPKYT